MLDIKLISTIVGIFAGLGIMIGGCGYTYSTWKAGKNKYKDELIVDLKATVIAKEEVIARLNGEKTTLIISHQDQLTAMQKELTSLQVKFEEQNKKLAEYRTILEGRDPKVFEVLGQIKDGITVLNKHHELAEKQTKQVAKTLKENPV